MSSERFQPQDRGSFFGDMIYDRVVPADHFLRKLEELVPWGRFTRKLIKCYRGKARQGRPPYDPAVLLKMLLVAYLYNLSERQTEVVASDSLSIKWFLGLGADEAPPDHSTLTAFKRRLIDNGQVGTFEAMLADMVRLAQEKGVRFGSIQVMDSVHTVANVNVDKDHQRRKHPGRGPRDPGAGWGVKDSWPGKTVQGEPKRDEQGRVVKDKLSFYGYKAHVSLNAEAQMITSVKVTAGGAYDGHQLPALLKQDLDQGLEVGTVAADKGYDDGANHELLRVKGVHSAIRLNEYRTQKKDKHKEVWLALQATPEYQQGGRERYKIERKFGEAKQGHGLGRCRYLGGVRYAIQAFLTALALNLKRMVKVLTGVNFKGRASAAG
jgi:IS5 family transposase